MCLNFVMVEPYEIYLTTKVFQTTVIYKLNIAAKMIRNQYFDFMPNILISNI